MTSTGVVRNIDELGRFVIPKEIRKIRNINANDKLLIEIQGDRILITKYQPSCIICGDSKNIKLFKEKRICTNCIKFINENF